MQVWNILLSGIGCAALVGAQRWPRRRRRRKRSMCRCSPTGPARSPAPAFRSPTACTIISTCSTSATAASAASRSSIEECETGYDTKKGVECYEQVKGKKPVVINPYSTGITLQLIPKASVDKIPVLSMAYGLSASAVGNDFPWIFNPPATYWDGAVDDLQLYRRARKAASTS